jgi:hypothetical protein
VSISLVCLPTVLGAACIKASSAQARGRPFPSGVWFAATTVDGPNPLHVASTPGPSQPNPSPSHQGRSTQQRPKNTGAKADKNDGQEFERLTASLMQEQSCLEVPYSSMAVLDQGGAVRMRHTRKFLVNFQPSSLVLNTGPVEAAETGINELRRRYDESLDSALAISSAGG